MAAAVAVLATLLLCALIYLASWKGSARASAQRHTARVLWCSDCRSGLLRRVTPPPRCYHCNTVEAGLLACAGIPADSPQEIRDAAARALLARDLQTLRILVRQVNA